MTTVVKSVDAKTILQSLLQDGHNPERQCQSGYCGCCRMKLMDGEVEYLDDPMAWLNEGEILPCVCTPKTDTVTVAAAI